MTDIELAKQLFAGTSSETSTANASIITGTALASSNAGKVLVLVNGAQGSQINRGVLLPCTFSVAAGDTVIITLYGEDGHGKKGFVSGKIGEGGGGDISGLENRVTTLEGEVSSLDGQVSSLISSVSSLTTRVANCERWGYYFNLGTLSGPSQMKGLGIYTFASVGGTLLSKWQGGNPGDYHGIMWDFNGNSNTGCVYGTMIVTTPRDTATRAVHIWNSAISSVTLL